MHRRPRNTARAIALAATPPLALSGRAWLLAGAALLAGLAQVVFG